jgi:GTP-binding protein EngB required for normal cell division
LGSKFEAYAFGRGAITLNEESTIKREEVLKKLAYHKWEQAGRPNGRDAEFWAAAEKDFAMFGQFAEKLSPFSASVAKSRLTFLLVGRGGMGKSSTVNNLFGEEVSPTNPFQPGTLEVKMYDKDVNGIACRFIDTPGLRTGSDQQILDRIASSASKFHCMLFVTRIDENRMYQDEIKTIQLLTSKFSPAVWQHAVIVLTHADRILPGSVPDFSTRLVTRADQVRAELRKIIPLDKLEAIPVVAANNVGDKLLPNGEDWLPELYVQVCRVIHPEGVIAYAVAASPVSLADPGGEPRFRLNEEQSKTLLQKFGEGFSDGVFDLAACRRENAMANP